MQIDLHPDLAAVAAIHAAVARPGESPPDVAFLQASLDRAPELRYLLAEGGAGFVGSIFPG